MDSFEAAYRTLNPAQRQAVEAIDGPVLVLAGPGTGKTQLLSARVANILRKTDTPANTILCLTFTESGASNMRERLSRFIGQAAYEVTISTYHAFGGDLIRRYPEFFAATRAQNPVDELGKRQILLALTEQMSYANPLKQTRHHIGDLIGTISELKRALVTPDQLRAIAAENLAFITAASTLVQEIFTSFTTMPRSLEKAWPFFSLTLQGLESLIPAESAAGNFGSLAAVAHAELKTALAEAGTTNKTTPLTDWKNKWLSKNAENQFMFDGDLQNRRVRALASALEHYQTTLEEQGLFDFDDMILRAIEALEKHPSLRYSLQERYLYLLLDEFQDTNAAQLKLIKLLTDNPVSEGRPNVMAVGDDDQAIYAFQGAQYSNMLDYYQLYRDVLVVNLTENYRSQAGILTTAQNIAGQISARLQYHFDGITKELRPAIPVLAATTIGRWDFMSPIAERSWTADRINGLIREGVKPSQIAILAPKHKYLEPLVPFLNRLDIPVRYEKREDILKAPLIVQLLTTCRLIQAIAVNNQELAENLWPQVLSFDFWQIPIADIWHLAWKVSDNKSKTNWSREILEHKNFLLPGLLLLSVASKANSETCETILDMLIGNLPVETHDNRLPKALSPLRNYYTSAQQQQSHPELFYQTVSHLTVLRARLSDYQSAQDSATMLPEFLQFIDMYLEAEQPMINTSPYSQQQDSVQLMTVFKAKGLEFDHVFLISCLDDVWGPSARDNGNKLTLPPNLMPIRHAGASEDERLRILFVALTRAKTGLYLTAAVRNFSGKPTKRLKFFDEREQPDTSIEALALPVRSRRVTTDEHEIREPEVELLELDWHARHLTAMKDVSLQGLLGDRLQSYQISPTHVTDFLNLEYAGPWALYFKVLLRFPQTPMPDAKFGTTIHQTMEWIQHRVTERGSAPGTSETLQFFRSKMQSQRLTPERTQLEIQRGEKALNRWLSKRAHIFKSTDIAERNFRSDGIFIGDAHLAGQIDRLEVDKTHQKIVIVDYKTGKPFTSWKSDPKLYRYRLQLCLYKLLVECSPAFKGYRIETGRLEFIEADEQGQLHQLELRFTEPEMTKARDLVVAVWRHVKELSFPEVSAYPASMAGIKNFEQDLLDGKI